MTIIQHNKKIISPLQNNLLIVLIAANLVWLMLVLLIKSIYYLSGSSAETFYTEVMQWLTLPANVQKLLTRPWTLLTYMFIHIDIWHVISNMLWLWAFGYILQNLIGSKKIIPLYLYGGWAGAIIYLVAFNIIPSFGIILDGSILLGASASVMAIATAATVLAPNYRLFPFIGNGIPLWVLTLVFMVMNIASISANNSYVYLSYIGGAIIGFVFIWQLKRGNDWSKWMQQLYNWVNNLFNPEKKSKGPRLYYKAKVKPFQKKLNVTQQKVDELLDKINQQGYNSLTDEEKELLRKASKIL